MRRIGGSCCIALAALVESAAMARAERLEAIDVQRPEFAAEGVPGLSFADACVSTTFGGAFERDPATGRTSPVRYERDLDSGTDFAHPTFDRFVYAIHFDRIVVLERSLSVCRLARVQEIPVESPFLLVGVIPGDGRHLYVGAAYNEILVFARDVGSGKLGLIESVGFLQAQPRRLAYSLAFSSEGGFAYLATWGGGGPFVLDGAILAYRRDRSSGYLELISLEEGSQPPGPYAPEDLATSPDGRNLYVADGVGGLNAYALDPLAGPFERRRRCRSAGHMPYRFHRTAASSMPTRRDGRSRSSVARVVASSPHSRRRSAPRLAGCLSPRTAPTPMPAFWDSCGSLEVRQVTSA